jgi:hypothetical protein
MQLLDKGLKYNLHHKHNKCIHTLVIEADTAISKLPEKEQGYMGQLVANNIQMTFNKEEAKQEKRLSCKTKRDIVEWKTIKTLNHRINQNQLIITEANKGNTLVILYKNA